MMHYLKVRWIHSAKDDPVLLYSEIDSERWEHRKIELFADGTAIFADAHEEHGDTGLSTEPLPSIKDIASDPQFEPVEISRAEFEQAWEQGKAHPR